jgi:hypothetical protein
MVKQIAKLAVLLLLVGLVAGPAMAQEPIVYPSKGQSQDQMEKDKYECYRWAKEQTGFDPMAAPTATTAPPRKHARHSTAGGAVRGGVGGGLLGLGVGAIAGNSKKGAAIGALSGAAIGGMRSHERNREDQRAQEEWAQREANNYARGRSEYNRAFAACLEGKGYTVK